VMQPSSVERANVRGADRQQDVMFSYVSAEERIPQGHPLRVIRQLVDPVLLKLSPRFDAIYSRRGRRSIAPEKLLRALLLQVLYSIRSERQLMEQLDYNILYRWFVGLNIDDAVWVPTVFSKNRERLLRGHIADVFMAEVLRTAEQKGLLSNEHFTVDGTLLEAWASLKSFQPKEKPARPTDDDPGNPTIDFRGEQRSNQTHASSTDPDARLARKSQGTTAQLCYLGNVVMDNREGLVVASSVTQPGYHAECDAALELLSGLETKGQPTVGADKGYDRGDFIPAVRQLGFKAHVSPNVNSRRHSSAVDKRTTRHASYEISQRKRKRVEEAIGWGKTVGLLAKLRHQGLPRVDWMFTFTNAAYNLVRMRTLIMAGVCP